MHYFPAPVFFIEESCLDQRPGMLGNSFKIPAEFIGNIFKRNPVVVCHSYQDRDPPMVGGTLEIPLQLLWCFHIHHHTLFLPTFQHSAECWNVVERTGNPNFGRRF